MTPYTIALFLHILGAVGAFFTVSLGYLSLVRMRQADSLASLRMWGSMAVGSTRLVFPLSGLVILLAGIYMVADSWRSVPGWVIMGVIGLLLIGAVTPRIIYQRFMALSMQAQDLPANAPVPAALAVQVSSQSLWLAMNAIMGLLVGVVFLMTVKPDLLGSIIALVVAVLVALGIAVLTNRRAAPAASTPSSPQAEA